jgi:hypothetical protein
MELTMIKIKHLLLAGALACTLGNAILAQEAQPKPSGSAPESLEAITEKVMAQEAVPEPLPASPYTGGLGSGVLQAIPRPPDVPGSLFAPAQPASTGGMPIGGPYLVTDPWLDPPEFPQPGWFAGAEVQIVKPHLITQYSNSVFPGKVTHDTTGLLPKGGNSTTVNLPSANLDWTAAPRVFLGYRLPSGFGEFMIAYRHLGATGSGSVPDTNGPLSLNTHFAFDMIDLDYNSRELSLWPLWDMKWTVGLRQIFLADSSQATQSFAQAIGGNNVVFARESSNFYGIGPHAALELNRRLGDSGWSFYSRADFAGTFDYVNEQWLTASATRDQRGRPNPGQTYAFGHQAAPMFTGRIGLTWKPEPTSLMRLFVGYQYDVIWNLDRSPQTNGTPFSPPSLGQFWDQGIVLQATINY